MLAKTPPPPYYAVIFSSIRTEVDNGYYEMNELLYDLAAKQEGFLGVEFAREEVGVSVSYWDSLEAIRNWKLQADHMLAQERGRKEWYTGYKVRIAKVEREYGFET